MSMNVPSCAPPPSPLRPGQWRSLELLEDTPAVLRTLGMYEHALGCPVYLRPVERGVTVMSLDSESPAMVGVGPSGGCCIGGLPPSESAVEAAVHACRIKMAGMKRRSIEEKYVLSRIRAALGSGLALGDGLLFLHQEWRFTTAAKADVLALDEQTGQLVVIEAKQSEAKALDPLTAEQGEGYVALLRACWADYLPYFQRLAAALARVYRPDLRAPMLAANSTPRWEAWWPGGRKPRSDSLSRTQSPAPARSSPLRVVRATSWRTELEQRQSRWREQQSRAMGLHRGEPLRTRFAMPDAEQGLWNFITPAIGQLVREEYRANASRSGSARKLYGYPRLFDNLLSSQPLAFNLFGELTLDLPAATRVGRRLWPGRVEAITRIEFEWSPGRQDPRYLDNGSAADIALFHTLPSGGSGVIFIETKYYEDLRVKQCRLKARYHEVAAASGAFLTSALPRLQHGVLQQLWFDHLLVLATRETDQLDSALFVVAYPEVNSACSAAVEVYAGTVDPAAPCTFEARTFEQIVDIMEEAIDAEWARAFRRRYLDPVDG
jgi:hypothetical protein